MSRCPTVDLGSHALTETYVAKEARWAYVDPTNDIAYVVDPDDRLVSSADIYWSSVTGLDLSLMARSIKRGTPPYVDFSVLSDPVRYFMHRENYLIFFGSRDGRYQLDPQGIVRIPYKVLRFAFQPQQYLGAGHFVSYHWLRPVSFFLSIVTGLLGAGLYVMSRRRHVCA